MKMVISPLSSACVFTRCRTMNQHTYLFVIAILTLGASAHAQPSIGNCPIFPPNNVWNTPVDKLPVLAASQSYINSNTATNKLHADLDNGSAGIPFAIVPAAQSAVTVTFDYAGESDPGPYPIPPNPPIEQASDGHILVVQTGACKLFELFAASQKSDGSWHAGSGAIFDLKSNQLRPDTWTSADAAGLPILPGLIRYDEVASGAINHALRLTVPNTRSAHVWPARHDASSKTGAMYPPMGTRFRLRADYDISALPGDAQVVLAALKKYGMILADNGSSWFITGAPDPRWNTDTITQINKVTGADLEAVDTSALIVSPDSGQAKGAAQRTDIPYSSAPNFDLSFNSTQSMTLTGDVSSSTLTGLADGAVYTFLICQDPNGAHAFTWPPNVFGGMTIGTTPGRCSAQSFVSDGVSLYATSPGSAN